MNSVLQDWVMELPLRAQGTLLTGIRGCDLAMKNPTTLDSSERRLVAFFRYCVMNPADEREVGITGSFFQPVPPAREEWKPSELGHYPLHWFSHLMHGFEVVGYLHPSARDDFFPEGRARDTLIAAEAQEIYLRMVESLHLSPESRDEMLARLTEDRIEAGTVVS